MHCLAFPLISTDLFKNVTISAKNVGIMVSACMRHAEFMLDTCGIELDENFMCNKLSILNHTKRRDFASEINFHLVY